MKVPIDLIEMKENELLSLARKCIRELNDRGIREFKIIER